VVAGVTTKVMIVMIVMIAPTPMEKNDLIE
jgi:hypothetical protein